VHRAGGPSNLAGGLRTRARTEFANRVLSALPRGTQSVHVRPSECVGGSRRREGGVRRGSGCVRACVRIALKGDRRGCVVLGIPTGTAVGFPTASMIKPSATTRTIDCALGRTHLPHEDTCRGHSVAPCRPAGLGLGAVVAWDLARSSLAWTIVTNMTHNGTCSARVSFRCFNARCGPTTRGRYSEYSHWGSVHAHISSGLMAHMAAAA
jgi:hypothetical protein